MWISQNIRYRPINETPYTKSSSADGVYTPFGFSSVAPTGENALVIPTQNGEMIAGYKMRTRALSKGEVEIFSNGGAYILLKNDGSVVINGLTISPSGEIED